MRIAITGGSGSLGRVLLARLAGAGFDRIVTFSRDEQKRLALQEEFAWHPGVKVYAGDIRDTGRMADIFSGCEIVVHAAARKVVSGHHDEPREMLLTNVVGTVNVMAAAREAGVRKLLFVSSDKAVAPINVYGVSKSLAEHLVISENSRAWAKGLRLSVIRYGNVLASNGSVVRKWRACLAAGRPVPFSDARMTRFWLTLEQAAGHVQHAVECMRGGEVLVPSLRAAPLTRLAAALGAEPSQWTDLGIRPGGEKLHEELLSADEARRTSIRNGFYVVAPTQTSESWDTAPWLGEPTPPDLQYRSDTWPDQWQVDDLREALR